MVKAGHKQTAVGLIPSDWQVEKLEEVAKLSSGTTPSRQQEDRYFTNGEFNWVKTTDLNNSKIIATEEKVTQAAVNETVLQIYPPGTVLVAMYGGFNQIGRTGLLEIPASVNQALIAIQPRNNKLVSAYLLAQLNYRVEFWKSVASSSRKDPNITSNDVREFLIPLPTTQEQQKIAEALADVDGLIAGLDTLIAKKRDVKTAVMQQLLAGKKRLPGFDTGQGYKQTELGEIPKDWYVKELESIIDSTRLGGNYQNQESETGRPLMKMGNLSRGYIDLSKIEYIPDGVVVSEQDKLDYGDLLFNTRNTLDLVGKVAIWRNELPLAYYNSNLLRFKFKDSEVDNNFYANYAFNTDQSIIQLKGFATGTTSVAAIYTRDLFKFKMILPPKPEQKAISDVLCDIDNEITALETRRAKTQAIKQGMMQELLTGRTRLV